MNVCFKCGQISRHAGFLIKLFRALNETQLRDETESESYVMVGRRICARCGGLLVLAWMAGYCLFIARIQSVG